MINIRQLLIGAVVISAASFSSVYAHQSEHKQHKAQEMQQEMMIHGAWSRALPPVATNGAAYLMVHNNSKIADKLIAVSSPIAKTAMLHQSVSRDGHITMEHQSSIVIDANDMVMFKPGGYHVMLMGLKRPLVSGQSFELTLTFENAGDITTTVMIKKDAGGNSHQHHH